MFKMFYAKLKVLVFLMENKIIQGNMNMYCFHFESEGYLIYIF